MATVDELRKFALALPETTEGTHFRLAAFRVADEAFIGIEKGDTHATFSLAPADIAALTAESPGVYEELRRNGKFLIGVRVELKRLAAKQLKQPDRALLAQKGPKKAALGATFVSALSRFFPAVKCRANAATREVPATLTYGLNIR